MMFSSYIEAKGTLSSSYLGFQARDSKVWQAHEGHQSRPH